MVNPTDSEQVIRRLYQITNNYNKGFEYQVGELLHMGLDRFNLDIGILSHIEGNTYTVKNCVAPDSIALQAGDTFEFNKTYCHITYAAKAPVALEHVGNDDQLGTHPAYKNFGLESYIAVPIKMGGEPYGTLNFSSPNPYPRKFLDTDIDALQLMASWIEVELIRREQEQKLNQLNRELEQQADYDGLTNVLNRRGMYKHLRKELNRLLRDYGQGTLALVDIDYFKAINDRLGHLKGDEVLVATVGKIAEALRDYDFVARFGGEEFLLWLPDAEPEVCEAICGRIRRKVSEIPLTPEPVTVSIGACHFRFSPDTPGDITRLMDNLLAKADKALYQAKADGRNRLVCCDAR